MKAGDKVKAKISNEVVFGTVSAKGVKNNRIIVEIETSSGGRWCYLSQIIEKNKESYSFEDLTT